MEVDGLLKGRIGYKVIRSWGAMQGLPRKAGNRDVWHGPSGKVVYSVLGTGF